MADDFEFETRYSFKRKSKRIGFYRRISDEIKTTISNLIYDISHKFKNENIKFNEYITRSPFPHPSFWEVQHLHRANRELKRICEELDTPGQVEETGWSIFKKAFEKCLIRGYPTESMVSACVYNAVRIHKISITLDEVSAVSKITKKRIAQSYIILITRMNFEKTKKLKKYKKLNLWRTKELIL